MKVALVLVVSSTTILIIVVSMSQEDPAARSYNEERWSCLLCISISCLLNKLISLALKRVELNG